MTSKKEFLSPIERAVLATVAYVDQFSYPLTVQQLLERCLALPDEQSVHQGAKTKVSLADLKKTVSLLQEKKLLEQTIDKSTRQIFLHLPGRKELVSVRSTQELQADQKQAQVDQVVRFCQGLPWIVAVYLTGSLAMHVAQPDSDIDFLLVTKPKRVWLSRLLVSVFAQLHGKRRSWNHEEPDSWCFNLWLDTDHLQVESSKQDVYRGYEVLQAKKLFDQSSTHSLLLRLNSWIKKLFLFPPQPLNAPVLPASSSWIDPVLDLLDWIAWKLQSWYMQPHQTTEKVSRGYAFFHPRDTKHVIYRGWLKSLQCCLSKQQALEILQAYVGDESSATEHSSKG